MRKNSISTPAIVAGVFLGFIALIAMWSVGNYNSLISGRNSVEKSWSMVETQYQRRLDLIDNLVSTVKGAQIQEQKVFGDIANARSKYAGSSNSSEQAESAGQVESALARLLVITENYPELKSNQNVQALQTELGKTEDGISKARDNYNNTATNYNTNVERFPKNIFAKMFNFQKQKLFKSESGAEKAPKVKF